MKELTTYLIFNGNCRQAMQFYAKCLNAELHMMSFGESPGEIPKEAKDRVMHARLAKGAAVVMASDNMPGMAFQQGDNFSIAVTCDNVDETDRIFNALADQGKIKMPLQETFWAFRFGMLTDQFGINWMVTFNKPAQA